METVQLTEQTRHVHGSRVTQASSMLRVCVCGGVGGGERKRESTKYMWIHERRRDVSIASGSGERQN